MFNFCKNGHKGQQIIFITRYYSIVAKACMYSYSRNL
jgi:hypothetical protein